MMERCLTIQIRPSEEEEEEPGSSGLFSNSHTVLILTVMVGCFGVLWPKIFSPMLFGDQDQRDSQPDLSEESLSSCEVSPYRPQDDQCYCCSWWRWRSVPGTSQPRHASPDGRTHAWPASPRDGWRPGEASEDD